MCPECLIRLNRRVNSTSWVRYAQTRHHRTDHLGAWKDIRIEKDLSTACKDCSRLKKDNLRFEVISVNCDFIFDHMMHF